MRWVSASPRAATSAVASSRDRALPASARTNARRSCGAAASGIRPRLLRCPVMKVAALAGGIGAGKFLRGLVRVVAPEDVTVIVNTGDDIVMHGLRVSPDLDSVTYWLGDAFDRDRGWGRRGETFRATEELG